MYYTKFRIQNFKGIRDTTIKLSVSDPGIFTFVGLNESGKTTILEALHSFSPDYETSEMVPGPESTESYNSKVVPRHKFHNFSGSVAVSATLYVNDEDWVKFAQRLEEENEIKIGDKGDLKVVEFVRETVYERGDFVESRFKLLTEIKKKSSNGRMVLPSSDEREKIRDAIYDYTPDIAYFPSFVFNFPDRVYLTPKPDNEINDFYRRVFNDVVSIGSENDSVEDSILRRLTGTCEAAHYNWEIFLSNWGQSESKAKVQQVIDQASITVNTHVIEAWNEIFSEDNNGKEIIISFDVSKGAAYRHGTYNGHNVELYITFQIKDGIKRFDINQRSLGFRWFLSFMLFTKFRSVRDSVRPVLFLFDEPASNLHSTAQQKLIESFPKIANNENMVAYTTHSHYMVDPIRLEQTFVVTNSNGAPITEATGMESTNDEDLDINATKYSKFVDQNPDYVNYFQPILERLDYTPSRFDVDRSSIILEGKSDYYILRYACSLLDMEDLPLIPSLGASSMNLMISLHLGWGLKMLLVFDADLNGEGTGTAFRDKCVNEYGINPAGALTTSEVVNGIDSIEDLFNAEAKSIIETAIGRPPSKKDLWEFCQRGVASDNCVDLGSHFSDKARLFLTELNSRLGSL